MYNRTKIICTIGPTSEDPAVLRKMISAGMDAVRLNFSHGSYQQFSKIIRTVRQLSKENGREVAIIQDLQGPKIRIGELPPHGVSVKKGDRLVLSTLDKPLRALPGDLPVQYAHLGHDVKRGDTILIDDGLIELTVQSVNTTKTKITCDVIIGGVIKSHKGINVPTASISAPPLTAKDREDVRFGISHDVDYIALSFVKDHGNIEDFKKILMQHKSRAQIIAKIERHEAIKNMEAIIEASDAVMVARGDLGIEIPAAEVPVEQKKIIHLCNIYGKPVIVATQMLDSMVSNPRATRAEISDAATAIFDHADALMLANETAVGRYPVEATRTLAHVATAVERNLKEHQHLLRLQRPEDMPLVNATCLNACKLATDINAKFIVAVTRSGFTAREIAKYRPFIPLIVLTPNKALARQMSLVWGVTHTFVQFVHIKNPLPQIRHFLLAHKLAKTGDEIVICNAGFGRREKLITTTML